MNFNLNFRSLDARRSGGFAEHVNINNNSTITQVTKDGNKLSVGFVFTSTYEPNIGLIRIEGDVAVEDTQETIDEAYSEWEKSQSKKLPKNMAEKTHHIIISNCMVEASILARDVKLPAPMPVPKMGTEKKEPADTGYIR